MEFVNKTQYPASFLPGSTSDNEMLGIIACKVTYMLERDWLVPIDNKEDSWPIFDKPYFFEGVQFLPELEFRKEGTDIIVFGNAVAQGGKPVKNMKVGIECGGLKHEAMIFGDRIWEKSLLRLSMSEPEPFVEMPITNDRAYGGKAVWEGIEIMHSINPDGKGFYLSSIEAEGKPLPNLERPGALIKSWKDQPVPACFHKPLGFHVDQEIARENPDKILIDTLDRVFNQAVPELIVPSDQLGTKIRLTGFSEDGDIFFPMPPSHGPHAYVTVGDLRAKFPSSISTLVILVSQRVLVVTYLCVFRYLFRPMETRHVELRWEGDTMVKLA